MNPIGVGQRFPAAWLLAFACVTASQAFGQEQETSGTFLEEIIVVATKRPERLQDVPVAVTAISGEALEKSGVEDVYELQEQALKDGMITLRMDGMIKGLWRDAMRSGRRDYDVWIFSDHGQESTRSFALTEPDGIEQVTVGEGKDLLEAGRGRNRLL